MSSSRAAAGNRDAFERLLRRHYDRIHRLAWRLTGSVVDAEDVAQDVCCKLVEKIDTFKGDAKFTTWLTGIVVNACRDRHRRGARKVLVEEATSSLFPIAKDVKIQVEFNPAAVAEYRLIGYETRLLDRNDFNNDKVDAGEVGSGQSVTALYEIVPVGAPSVVGDLRYAPQGAPDTSAKSEAGDEYAFVKIRYELPDSDVSKLIETPVDRSVEVARFEDAPADTRFATSVAAFGEILRGGRHTGAFGLDDVLAAATSAAATTRTATGRSSSSSSAPRRRQVRSPRLSSAGSEPGRRAAGSGGGCQP